MRSRGAEKRGRRTEQDGQRSVHRTRGRMRPGDALTSDKVLDEGGHTRVLECLDGVPNGLTAQERVRREPFPVAAVPDGTTHRTDDDGKGHLSSEAGVFGALGGRAEVDQVAVEGGGRGDLGGPFRRVLRVDACMSVLKIS